jgi:hypothetical protein
LGIDLNVRQIKSLDKKIVFQISRLWLRIPQGTSTLNEYLLYIFDRWRDIALFGVFDGDELIAYTHAEPPHPLDKEVAFLPFSSALPRCTREMGEKALSLAEQWMSLRGAKRWKMETLRNPKAMARKWGLKVLTDEIPMGREINVENQKNPA